MLAVEKLHFAYKDKDIVRGLDLNVQEGELVGIIGPNGVGKTTLLRLISGVLKPSLGRIRVNGIDLATLNASQRSRLVSMVPQNPRPPLSFTVMELVLLGRNPHLKLLEWEGHRDFEAARQSMELTGTWHLANRPIPSLSGGEFQRTLVAMALAQEAAVMLLDEPTSSLDLAHQTGIMDLISNVQKQRGGGVVVAMHDLTLAAQYCNRLVMLAEGQAYAEGTPGSVLTKENISAVYGASVAILAHPGGGTPVVLPMASDGSKRSHERHGGFASKPL